MKDSLVRSPYRPELRGKVNWSTDFYLPLACDIPYAGILFRNRRFVIAIENTLPRIVSSTYRIIFSFTFY